MRADQGNVSICWSCPVDGGSPCPFCEIAQPLLLHWPCRRVSCPYRLHMRRAAVKQLGCWCWSQPRSGCDAKMCAVEAWGRRRPGGQQPRAGRVMSVSMEGAAGHGACSGSNCWRGLGSGEPGEWWVCLGLATMHYFAMVFGSTQATRQAGAAGSCNSSGRVDAVSGWLSMAHSAAPRPKTWSSLASRKDGGRGLVGGGWCSSARCVSGTGVGAVAQVQRLRGTVEWVGGRGESSSYRI